MKFNDIALNITNVLLPRKGTDMTKWAAVACDQFTSQPDYWDEAYKTAENAPSTLNLMLPEIYLEDEDVEDRIKVINGTMKEYLSNGTLEETEPCMILIKRDTKASPVRTGVVVALDLEKYDFTKGSDSLIRATEGTVTERIPPRMKVRKNADVELPHIMILIDDPDCTAVEKLSEYAEANQLSPVYDFEMMMKGGSITGWKITDEKVINDFAEALRKLASPDVFNKKYGLEGVAPLLYAVGDGNHSLASAKCHWEELKKQGASMDHPARYALVEIVNVHDKGIIFEPIHRVLFGVNEEDFTDSMLEYFGENASYVSTDELNIGAAKADATLPYHTIPVCFGNFNGIIYIDKKEHTLAVGAIQKFIDEYLKEHPEVKIDYVHGNSITAELGGKDGNAGIFLPAMEKSDLFLTVIKNGSLPRKTFSMGEAFEKRYYVEARKITEA
jgi:hypothetical protein